MEEFIYYLHKNGNNEKSPIQMWQFVCSFLFKNVNFNLEKSHPCLFFVTNMWRFNRFRTEEMTSKHVM